MRRALVISMTALGALALPSSVTAHALSGRLQSPLPLIVYLVGAALTVALSFVFVMLRELPADSPARARSVAVPRVVALGLRAIGLIAWLWIVAQTVVGGSSDADVASLFLLVYGWVGVALVSALVGPVWTWLDPFTTLFDILTWFGRRFGITATEPARYPTRLGAWPAAVGLAFFVWIELIYFGGLGMILIGYTILTLALMAYFGRDVWRQNGETFSVWFGVLNRLAPFGAPAGPESLKVEKRPYGAGLLSARWTTPMVAVAAIGTASILYDGLSQTLIFYELLGVMGTALATIYLFTFLTLVVALAVAVGRLVGIASVAAGLVPIAVGYLIAHYLTYLLADGQRILVAVSDPLQLGWDLFGTAFYQASMDWLPASIVWSVMLASVVGGHVVGAWAGHSVAVRDAPKGVNPRLRQIPLAVFMVALTATTLWSLGQAIVSEPPDGPAPAVQVNPGG